MSSTLYKTNRKSDGKSVRRIVMRKRQGGLSEYVRAVLGAKNLNYREVARRSGGLISHATVGDVINNPGRRVSVETLKALAKGLGVPEDELLVVAAGRPPEDPAIEN